MTAISSIVNNASPQYVTEDAGQSSVPLPDADRSQADSKSERGKPPDDKQAWVEVVDNPAALMTHLSAWETLAASVIEPNPFYESWMLLPAIRSYGRDKHLRFALVYRREPEKKHPVLSGFFPLERRTRYRGIPVPILRLWQYKQCLLCTPLIHRQHLRETLQAFFTWLITDAESALMEFNLVHGEGLFHQALIEEIHHRQMLTFQAELYLRALFQPAESADAYLRQVLRSRRRKDLRLQARHLAEQGAVTYRMLDQEAEIAEVQEWIRQFLELESRGWKGREGGALGLSQADRDVFTESMLAAFEQGRLEMLALHLNGEPIAFKCNLLAPPGAFAIRIAYDETYARFSPGMLLELENIRLHQAQGNASVAAQRPHSPASPSLPEYSSRIEWMDSCAIADHWMLNRLWKERRVMQTLLMATGTFQGDLVIALLPVLRWLNRCFRLLQFQAKPRLSPGLTEDQSETEHAALKHLSADPSGS